MLILFLVIWLGIPELLPGGQMVESIPAGTLKDGTYQGEAKGFAGKIKTEVGIKEGKIEYIKVLEHNESRGWYEEVFLTLPKEMVKKQRIHVDVISGATKTSKGLMKSVENAVKNAM